MNSIDIKMHGTKIKKNLPECNPELGWSHIPSGSIALYISAYIVITPICSSCGVIKQYKKDKLNYEHESNSSASAVTIWNLLIIQACEAH
jgi:hypothetical protein